MAGIGLNRVTLIGNLGKDPDLRTTPQGNSVCSFPLATTERYKDRNGEWKDITDWHEITLWDNLAERARKSLRKGSKVFIEGKLKTRSYEKDGITRYRTEVRGQTLILLDPRQPSENLEHSSSYSNSSDYGKDDDIETNLANDVNASLDDDDIPF